MQPEIKKSSKNPNPIIDIADASSLSVYLGFTNCMKSSYSKEDNFCFRKASSENLFSAKRPLPLCTGLKL